MSRRRIAVTMWLAGTIALFFIPGPEVEVGRTRDGDSESVTVMPLTDLLAVASLAVGLVAIALVVLWRRRSRDATWRLRKGR